MKDRDWADDTTMGSYSIYVTEYAGITVYVSRWQTADTMRKMAAALLQAADYSEAQESK